jgi:DNA invertase Pin-like site-specific DNA recombinase
MKIGYARVSTKDQSLNLQTDALTKAGCEIIFNEIASGAKSDRVELDKLFSQIRKGDILVVYKLDRLGRSLKHLLEFVAILNEKQIGLQSISDAIDTTTPQGRLFFNISACFSEFERDLIRERTRAGLEAARARGLQVPYWAKSKIAPCKSLTISNLQGDFLGCLSVFPSPYFINIKT